MSTRLTLRLDSAPSLSTRRKAGASSWAEDCDSEVNEGGAACVCLPGETLACYGGPPDTLDVGACHGGMHTCDADGLGFLACAGEVMPGVEDCAGDDVDEDCDGLVDESGPTCVCGDGVVSQGEACDDGNTKGDDGCSADCQQSQEVVQISAGQYHAWARFAHGKVKCWGFNAQGQLGLGDTNQRGDQPGEMGAALPFVDLGANSIVVEISAGAGSHTCARLADDTVKCWGSNDYGGLGLGDKNHRGDQPGEMGNALPTVFVGNGVVTNVSCGGGYSCVRFANGQLKCWGWNVNGELGQGDTKARGDDPGEMAVLPTIPLPINVLELSSGPVHVCARGASGIKCWGGNNATLGTGNSNNIGDAPGEVAGLGYIDLAPTKPLSVSAGYLVTCARMDDQSVRCWGSGGLGLGTTDVHGDDPGEMGLALPAIDVGGPVEALFDANYGACVRLVGGALKCWGGNNVGQLGLGDTEDRGDEPGEMGAALPKVDLAGGAVLDVVAGALFRCALLAGGSVKCWGQGNFGQLGQGDKNHRGDQPGEMGVALPPIQLY